MYAIRSYYVLFSELVDYGPKHILSKRLCKKLISVINQDKELISELVRTKKLPVKRIEITTGINRKKFERYRKYIIAVLVIKNGEYQLLKEYII